VWTRQRDSAPVMKRFERRDRPIDTKSLQVKGLGSGMGPSDASDPGEVDAAAPPPSPNPPRVMAHSDSGAWDELSPPTDPQPLSRGQLQDRAIRGASWTMIHTLLAVAIGFLINILIARVLGAVDFGRLTYLTALLDVLRGVASLGVGTALVQFATKAHAAGQSDDVRSLLSKAQGFRLLVVAPLLSIAVVSVANVPTIWLVVTGLFGIVLPAALSGATSCLTIENKTAEGAKSAMIANLLTQVAVVVVVLTIATADALWAARLVMGGITAAIALAYVSRRYLRAALVPSLPRRFPPGFWRFALPTGAAAVIGNLVVSRSEVLALTWLSTPEATGVFALAFGLAVHMFSPAQALLGPLVPAISGLQEVDSEAIPRALARTFRATSTAVGLTLATAVPAFAVLVPAIYGDDFVQVPPVLIALSVAGGFSLVALPVSAFVMARLSGRKLLQASAVALVVDVVLALALIPLLGVWGAVAANISAAATQLAILLRSELRAQGLPARKAIGYTKPAFVGAIVCVGAWLTVSALSLTPVAESALACALGGSLVVLGLRVTRSGLDPADAEAVLRAAPGSLQPTARRIITLVTIRERR